MANVDKHIQWGSVASITVAVACLANPTWAGDIAAAEALFREARDLLADGKVGEACNKFAESQRLDPSSGTLLNLASCHETQGKTATAWAEFLVAARMAQAQGQSSRAEEARRRAAALESSLSYLSITVEEPLPNLTVFRDDVRVDEAALRSRIPVDPGTHVIRAAADGYRTWSIEVLVEKEGDAKRVTIPKLEPLLDEGKPQPTRNAPREGKVERPLANPDPVDTGAPSGDNTLAYVIGGVGVIGVGVGATFGWMAISAYDDAEQMCPTHAGCSADAMDKRDSANGLATISNVATGLGLVGVGAGVVLLLTSGSGGSDSSAHGVRVEPTAGTGAAGAMIRGTF